MVHTVAALSNGAASEALLVPTLFRATLASRHYLDVFFLLRQWSMLHRNVPGGKISVLTEPLSQTVGALVQALQLLQFLTGHLHGGKSNVECVHWEALSHWSGRLLPWSCPHLLVHQVLNVSSVVAIPMSTAQHPESSPANGVHQGPAVWQHLDLPDLQHAAVVSKTGEGQGERKNAELGYWQ